MASTSSQPPVPPRPKLGGYEFYKFLGSPKYIVAPMVDQSELPWRILSRRYGGQITYTPMINAKMFAEAKNPTYRAASFNSLLGEEGDPNVDRPLIVQFCANDPQMLLRAAQLVEPYCDAVDINFGCPQDIAKRGRYGSFLQDDWQLIHDMINTLHINLSIPVTAKFRAFPSLEKTVEYAKMMEKAGAQMLTCHGRIREQRGQYSGLADWDKIRAVKEAVSVPVFANGNILFAADIAACLEATGADGVMSAEGNLYNPTLFWSPSPSDPQFDSISWIDAAPYLEHTTLASEYLDIIRSLKTPTGSSAIKGHLFKLMRPALCRETDLRERLGRVRDNASALEEFEGVVQEMKERMKRDIEGSKASAQELVTIDPATGLRVLPHWLAQPYFRPLLTLPTKKTQP